MTAREVLDGIKDRLTKATPGPWEALHRPTLPHENDPDILAAKRDEMGGEPGSSVWARERQMWGSLWPSPNGRADAVFIAAAPVDVARLTRAIEDVLALAETWRYKGEFGWGAWQEGHGPDPEGYVLDTASGEIRAAIEDALNPKEGQ